MKKNPVIFWEIASNDSERSIEFFKKVFDWDIRKTESSPIHYISTSPTFGNFDGGVFTLRKAKLPFLTIYIQVEDINETVKKIEDAGGFIVEAPIEIVPGTIICLFNEPSGVKLGLLQQTEMKNG